MIWCRIFCTKIMNFVGRGRRRCEKSWFIQIHQLTFVKVIKCYGKCFKIGLRRQMFQVTSHPSVPGRGKETLRCSPDKTPTPELPHIRPASPKFSPSQHMWKSLCLWRCISGHTKGPRSLSLTKIWQGWLLGWRTQLGRGNSSWSRHSGSEGPYHEAAFGLTRLQREFSPGEQLRFYDEGALGPHVNSCTPTSRLS